MGDFFVHNVQFYDYKSVAINSLAYDDDAEQLAVGFKNGAISIYNTGQGFYQTQFIVPSVLTSVEALCWMKQRLFSCGLTGFVSEIDPLSGTLKCQVPTHAMGAWCISSSKNGSQFAVGTETGAVSLFKIDETSGELEYTETLQRASSRILSISWSSFDPNLIVTAGVGFIALIDLRHGIVQKEFPTKPETAVVWDVAFLTNDIVASADSTGHVVLWSFACGGAVQRFSAHRSHVLCLATHGSTLFAAGVDAVIRRYDCHSVSGEWFEATVFRRHTHDVRALAVSSQGLVSGGEEGRLHVFPLDREAAGVQEGWQGAWSLPFAQPRHPYRAAMSRATKKENGALEPPICVLQYSDRLELFRLGATIAPANFGKRQRRIAAQQQGGSSCLPLSAVPKKLLVVTPKKAESIACSAISENGLFFAYSTSAILRIFAVKAEGGEKEALHLSRLSLGPLKPKACRLITFTPNCDYLVGVQATDGCVVVWSLASASLIHRFVPSNENYASPASHLLKCGGPTGDLIALGCLDGHVYVYSASDGTRLMQLPLRKDAKRNRELPLIPTALALAPHQRRVLALYTDHKFLEMEISEEGKGNDDQALGSGWFSRFNERRPKSWYRLQHFDWLSYIDRHRVLVANSRQLFVLDTAQRVKKALKQATLSEEPNKQERRKKRSRKEMEKEEENSEEMTCLRSTDSFRFILHVEVLSKAELAVVALSPDSYTLSLPPTLAHKRFGV